MSNLTTSRREGSRDLQVRHPLPVPHDAALPWAGQQRVPDFSESLRRPDIRQVARTHTADGADIRHDVDTTSAAAPFAPSRCLML